MPSEPFSDSWLLYVPSNKQQQCQGLTAPSPREPHVYPISEAAVLTETLSNPRASSAEHSCSEFTSKQKSLASARLPECHYDNSQHKCHCKQLHSKKTLKQNKPDVHFISHTLLLKACYKENPF